MKRLILLFAILALWGCSEKEVAGISTVETENAFVIQIVREDSLPAANVVARMRAVDYVQSFEDGFAGELYYEEFVADSLGCFRVDSLAVDAATLEILDNGEGLFKKLSAEDVRDGDSVQFVMEKTGSLRGKVYLPDSVGFAWVQVYGTDRLVKTDGDGFYEMDSLPPFEYDLRYTVGDSVVEKAAAVDAGEKTTTYIYAFQPDSVKVLDFESDHEEFFINDLGFAVTGYMSSTDSGVTTVPALDEGMESFIDSAGAGRKGRALHWTSSAMFGKWSFFGTWICEEGSPCDLSTMDSVVFYARGTGVISIAFETLGASNTEGKTLAYDTLDTGGEWKRVSLKPSNFKPRDDMYGNLGWDIISKAVTTISIAAYDETEFWIDDVVLYGVRPSDFAIKP